MASFERADQVPREQHRRARPHVDLLEQLGHGDVRAVGRRVLDDLVLGRVEQAAPDVGVEVGALDQIRDRAPLALEVAELGLVEHLVELQRDQLVDPREQIGKRFLVDEVALAIGVGLVGLVVVALGVIEVAQQHREQLDEGLGALALARGLGPRRAWSVPRGQARRRGARSACLAGYRAAGRSSARRREWDITSAAVTRTATSR